MARAREIARTGGHPGVNRWTWALVVAASGLAACTPAMPPEDATPRNRFDWSVERYEAGKYHDAIRGFRDHLLREPLHPTADSSRLLLGEAYLKTNQELMAANEFRQLATSRPNSPLADDAQLGVCRSYWRVSPDIARDQEFTQKTIEECTQLLEFFPRSPLGGEAREIIADARQKMAAKDLAVARFYFDRGIYESAMIYLENIMQTYPEADIVPQALLVLYDCYYKVGFRAEAESISRRLLELFPESPEAAAMNERLEDQG